MNLYCIRGVIQYNCVDYSESNGELLFIKPVLNGSEPPDIRAYAASHQHFPHEATSNQFFNEAQFESYRHLGSWMISSYFDNVPDSLRSALGGCDISSFFANVKTVHDAGQTNTADPPPVPASAAPLTLPAGET